MGCLIHISRQKSAFILFLSKTDRCGLAARRPGRAPGTPADCRSPLQPSHRQQTVPQTDTLTHDVHLPRIVSLLLFHFRLSLNIARPAPAPLGYKEAGNRTWSRRNCFVVGDIQVSTKRFGECCCLAALQM